MCGMANTTGHCDGEGKGESTKGMGQLIVTNYRMHPLEIALAASRERERIMRQALGTVKDEIVRWKMTNKGKPWCANCSSPWDDHHNCWVGRILLAEAALSACDGVKP